MEYPESTAVEPARRVLRVVSVTDEGVTLLLDCGHHRLYRYHRVEVLHYRHALCMVCPREE